MPGGAAGARPKVTFPALVRTPAMGDTIIRYALALSSLALVLSTGTSYSGPCTQQIFDVRSAAGKKLSDIAAMPNDLSGVTAER